MAKHCGAKTRAGGLCGQLAMPNGRCRMHGGKSTGPKDNRGNQNARKHGIYAKHLTAEELCQFGEIELGAVDQELRLTRIRLARALAAEHESQGKPELLEVTENEGGGPQLAKKSSKSLVRDYTAIIDRLVSRIESLERTRKLLDAGNGDNDGIEGFETVPYDD
jgi:hypothetical protein